MLTIGGTAYFKVFAMESIERKELEDGTQIKFRTTNNDIEVYKNDSWSPLFIKGVNLGATLPGEFPGSLPITKDDYLRWFGMIKDMGVNTIRIYTIHKPVFYEALVEFNQRHGEDPLYFMQGVWSPVNLLKEQQDAQSPEVTKAFKEEIKRAVGAVYGDITIPEKDGKASGKYTANAGQYLLAWHLGTEWGPKTVQNTNEQHADAAPVEGDHFKSKPDAAAFDKWLAELLNYTAELEKKHGWEHPMTFTNWVTTDPLEHPKEPLPTEDLASVDATNIETENWKAGYFASYHAYPYYPDFLRLTDKYNDIKNAEGKVDPYKGYLRELKDYHEGMPIMITEFGVPSSLGNAHIGALGRDQGGHTEKQQGKINTDLLNTIYQEDYAGALVFEWQDEWFKKTWNTMSFEEAHSRPDWYNYLSNEMSYGLLGMYPGKEDDIQIDGKQEDWQKLKDKEKQDLTPNMDGWKSITATHDEGYMYITAKLEDDFNPNDENLYLGVNTISGGIKQGGPLQDSKLNEGLETLIRFGKEKESKVLISSDYDYHNQLYEGEKGKVEMSTDTGTFQPWQLPVSLKLEPPHAKYSVPFQEVEVGKLPKGTAGEFDSKDYQPQALWQSKGNVIEAKIPWALLGFSDPSKRNVVSYETHKQETDELKTKKTEGIQFVPWTVQEGSSKATGLSEEPFPVTELPLYKWEPWTKVQYAERKKESYYEMQEAFEQLEEIKK
ncbi:hypothetical protein [Pontibacillus yanchengensis]|uniref:Family 2 glycosyl transferase n=1 Tax=Pontibacillus yanchengensis Y32 TaxID=1385514 RepID=A0A0A2TJH3_9BACI|nr:hypothetical protein [Pontibacillus yanchengensis]KGP74226.1 hypothetical protein N782_09340 [Pontibacillus yanchengensis Y32]